VKENSLSGNQGLKVENDKNRDNEASTVNGNIKLQKH